MTEFTRSFIENVGIHYSILGRDTTEIEKIAKQQKLPDHLSPAEIAALFPDPDSRQWHVVPDILSDACTRGDLPASAKWIQDSSTERLEFFIHRDAARRYFQKHMYPPKECALWYWLESIDTKNKTTLHQREKADFQQLCLDIWAVSPTVKMTGPNGVVKRLSKKGSYFCRYTERKLADWAREVAPETVKGKRGRPRKER